MDAHNGRMGSEAPSSSSSDFYDSAPPNKQPNCAVTQQPAMNAAPSPDPSGALVDQEEDSSTEMDLADSRSPSPDLPMNGESQQETRADQDATLLSSKRKLSEEDFTPRGTTQPSTEGAKKPKLSVAGQQSTRGAALTALNLPTEIWQQVFLHLSPASLARCVRVCRPFKSYLMDTKAKPSPNKAEAKDLSKVRVLDSDAIWAHSRKMAYPNMPRPLQRLTELQILQLIGNEWCQFCGREPVPSYPTTPFNRGPGADGVRVFWPFGIRSCGRCIQEYTLKDVDVLQSQAGALRNGLPHCFLTPDLHFVSDSQRTAQGSIPAHLRVAKVYYSQDVHRVIQEHNDAISLGAGAAEEWKKGLIARGKEAMADAARWEQWESQLPYGTGLSQVLREYDLSSFSNSAGQVYSTSEAPNALQPTMAMNGAFPYSQQTTFPQHMSLTQPLQLQPSSYSSQLSGPTQPYGPVQTYSHPGKPAKAKSALDVEETLRARRADIERRCMELDPPLEPPALQHVTSFQATMQIALPITDDFWESTLKPRILAERDAAETAEQARRDQLVFLQAAVPHTAHDEPYTRPAKEIYDKEYEHAQEPLRRRLGEYADDFLNNHWQGGKIDKTNSPVFAVKVIEFVDRRYREDKLAGMLPPAKVTRGTRQGTPFPDPFLSLDNMKWVYDNKIRPRTDVHGRELFLCSGCTDSKLPKWLAFEGLIQHFGAKHTTAFSKGNVVVHWQTAEWPSDLPFVRDPTYYMKHEKKAAEPKGHGRSRRTPQANHGPFIVPGSGQLPSENPFFSGNYQSPVPSSNYYQQATDYPGYQNLPPSQPQAAAGGWQRRSEAPSDHAESTYDAQLNMLCNDISSIWTSLDGVKEDVLLEPIRVYTTINRATARFEARFGNKPNIDLLTAVLTSKPEVKPFKEANALACKLCVADQSEGSTRYPSYYGRIESVKLWNTSSLVSHFNIIHLAQSHRRSLDWTTSMIELPEPDIVSRLLRAPGMDDDKLATIALAFPAAFPWPLPKIGLIDGNENEGVLAQKMLDRHFKKKADPPKKKKKGQQANNDTPARDESEPLPEAKEDEYDPRRPFALPMDSRETTAFSSSAYSPPTAKGFSIPPETLAALSQLATSNVPRQQPAVGNRADRSPSVGRIEQPAAAPNISEILAQLTGQSAQGQYPSRSVQARSAYPPPQQTATPPDTTSRSSSQPKQIYAEPYGLSHPVSPRQYVDERQASLRYASQPVYMSSVEPHARHESHDVRLAQSYNANQFEQNRAQSFAEPTQVHVSRSPPHYRPAYEEAPQYLQPVQYAPVYRPEQPTQYVQVQPEYDRPATTYQYAHPPPEHKYVDEYGRELKLVPVDAASPPVHYASHPMEQPQPHQQYARYAPQAPPPAAAYASSPTAPQYTPQLYDDRRPVYYEIPGSEAARGSVPRR